MWGERDPGWALGSWLAPRLLPTCPAAGAGAAGTAGSETVQNVSDAAQSSKYLRGGKGRVWALTGTLELIIRNALLNPVMKKVGF